MRYQPLTTHEVAGLHKWESFPKKWRRLYIAQRGRCFLCGEKLGLGRTHMKVKADEWTREHVIPRSKGGTGTPGNVALAHKLCNARKGGRDPRPCERLFALAVGASVVAMMPIGGDRSEAEKHLAYWTTLRNRFGKPR